MKMKVVREDGSPCRLGPSVIRNILRIVDILPFLYIVGMVLIARSGKKQRLGDRVAHTVVVRQTPRRGLRSPNPKPTSQILHKLRGGILRRSKVLPQMWSRTVGLRPGRVAIQPLR